MTKRPIRLLFLITLLWMPGGDALALGGDAKAGAAKSEPCRTCHGADGKSIGPAFPRLAGQYSDYLAQALSDYRDGNRKNAVMAPFAASLSDEDIEDLAAYYAGLPSALYNKP